MVGACNSITMSFELNCLCMLLNNYIFWVELVGWHKQLNNYVWILKWKMSKYIYSGRYIGRGPHSDRHVTVASHQPLKNFIPKKKPLKNFPRKNHESNYCFSPTCVGLGFQLVDIILVPVPSTKINHHSSAESTRLTGPFTSRWRCRRDQITLSSRNFIQSSAGQQKKGVGMAWNASTSPA